MKKIILFLSVFAFANEAKISELQSSCDNKICRIATSLAMLTHLVMT
ncbi:hypothetical protein [Campylobacter mucosalis]|nr:hypothetical protein [Campylobacter mucosalis]